MMQKQRNDRTAILLLLAIFVGSSAATATDIFVNNRSGRDVPIGSEPIYDGGTQFPLLTIQAAVRRALPGDRIVLMPTDLPYRESVVFPGNRIQGHSVLPIILEGNGCTLDGTLPVSWDYWRPLGERRFAFEGAFLGRRPLFLDGKMLQPANTADWGPLPSLDPERYVYWQGGLVFKTAADRWIDEYSLNLSELRCGVFIHRANHIIVRNLMIRGYYQDGIQVRGPVKGVRIERCALTENGRSGLSVINNAETTVVGSFLTGNVAAGIFNQEFGRVTVTDCALGENPKEVFSDGTSKADISGAAPEPLPEGPFVNPPGAAMPSSPRPAAPEETSPTEQPEQKPSFFDEP